MRRDDQSFLARLALCFALAFFAGWKVGVFGAESALVYLAALAGMAFFLRGR